MFKFRNLKQVVRFRNYYYLPGGERSDTAQRLRRHRFASKKLMTARTSSLDFKDLGVNNLWKGDNLSWWRIQRAITQYPQSSTL